MNQAEKIRSNASVQGVAWAVKHAKKHGVNISIVLFALFNRY